MEKIKLYALKDNDHNFYTNYLLAKTDKDAIKYYFDSIDEVCKVAYERNDKKVQNLIDMFHQTAIYKLGEINPDTGELTNDLIYLADFKNVELGRKEEIKDECKDSSKDFPGTGEEVRNELQ